MATISTTLELVDRMSGRLTAITGRVQALADKFMQLDGRISGVQARMEALGMREFEVETPETPLPVLEQMKIPDIRMGMAELPVPEVPEPLVGMPETPMPEVPRMQVEMAAPAAPEMPAIQTEKILPPAPEIPAIQAEVTENVSEDGTGLLAGIAERIQAQQGTLAAVSRAAANAAVLAVRQGMPPEEGRMTGMRFAEGLARGINSRMSAVLSAARAVANAAATAARAALDIHSPSRAAEEIGSYFGTGFAEGISASGQAVSRAAGRLSGIAYRELDGQIWKRIQVFGELEQDAHAPDADGVYLSRSDAQRVRDLAEREAVKTFTTAELNIAFTANNTIDSKMDLDGVVSYLEEQVAEKLALAAEGVYA